MLDAYRQAITGYLQVIHVTVRFHEDLGFFLSRKPEARESSFSFDVTRSVKDMIESLGVPHVEVA